MRIAVLGIATCFAVVFVWGMFAFPDAPVYPCAQGYCGKHGARHSEAHYTAYVWWGRGVIALFMGVFVGLILLAVRGDGQQDNGGDSDAGGD